MSQNIAEEVRQKLEKRSGLSTSTLLTQVLSRTNDAVGGYFFKFYGIRQLVSGYNLSFEPLDTDTINLEKIELPRPLLKYALAGEILDMVDWGSINATLWIPSEYSASSFIDGLLVLPGKKLALGLIFTVSASHPVPHYPIPAMIFKCIKNGYRFRLVFVLKNGRNYDAFGRQSQTVDHRVCDAQAEFPCPQLKTGMF